MQRKKDLHFMFMIGLMVIIGALSALAVFIFNALLGFFQNLFFLGSLSFTYYEIIHIPISPWGVGIILVPILGGLVVIWLIEKFAANEKGLSVPYVMYTMRHKDGKIRPKIALAKTLASAISIGSGGSIGREGPIVQMASFLSSLMGEVIQLSVKQKNILIAAGASSVTSVIFNAPIAGVLFSIELLLIEKKFINIILTSISTIIASLFGYFLLNQTSVFTIQTVSIHGFSFNYIVAILFTIPLGIVLGVISVFFIRGVYWVEDIFKKIHANPYIRHLIGMSMVGVMIFLFMHFYGHYYIEGLGYATMQDVLNNQLSNFWFLLLLFVCKFIATCLTLGTGASGGIFCPCLFLGTMLGALYGILLNFIFPGLNINFHLFAMAGMASLLGGTTGALFTSVFLVFEMIKEYYIILPLLLCSITAYFTRKNLCRESIYTLKLLRQGKSIN